MSDYQKKRYKEDLEFKILKRLQARTNSTDVESIIGCSISFFIKWLKFCSKSNNRDEIHLHHVRPLNTFSDHLKYQAYHWTNILPINKHENLSVKDTRDLYAEEQQKKKVNQFLLSSLITSLDD